MYTRKILLERLKYELEFTPDVCLQVAAKQLIKIAKEYSELPIEELKLEDIKAIFESKGKIKAMLFIRKRTKLPTAQIIALLVDWAREDGWVSHIQGY